MVYTLEEGNIIREYKVFYDEERLRQLFNKIVRECSYKVKGKFIHRANEIKFGHSSACSYGILDYPRLLNGDQMYQDIIKVEDDFDGLSIENVTIEGFKVIVPKLAEIIASILNGDSDALKLLAFYENDDELISIDMQVQAKIKESRELITASEVDIDRFIEVSDELKELRVKQKDNHYFNTELLNRYYFEVVNLIGYELVSETKKQIGPVRRLSMSEIFGNNSNIKGS